MIPKILIFFNRHQIKFFLVCIWLVIISLQESPLELIKQYFGFVFLGITGAIFANSTGAGGGVVFVPFFNHLELSANTIIATSFAIQCCGMTAGALTWWRHFRSHHRRDHEWQSLGKGLFIVIPCSIAGVLLAQFGFATYTDKALESLHLYFGIFSIVLAIAIYISIPLMKREVLSSSLLNADIFALTLIAFGGGIITAWLSVGVGELVAVYLILRGFNVTFAIALAVILSAFTVWGAIAFHIFVSQGIYWEVVMFAGAGAIIGGIIARYVVLYFSVIRLKVFFASWVLVMGVAGLPVW